MHSVINQENLKNRLKPVQCSNGPPSIKINKSNKSKVKNTAH